MLLPVKVPRTQLASEFDLVFLGNHSERSIGLAVRKVSAGPHKLEQIKQQESRMADSVSCKSIHVQAMVGMQRDMIVPSLPSYFKIFVLRETLPCSSCH